MLEPQRRKRTLHLNPQNHHPHHDERADEELWPISYQKTHAAVGLLQQIRDSDDDEDDQMPLSRPYELPHLGV
jgi:hypothetical protein